MEHLVEGHMGGFWIDNRDPEDIEEYCEECGDYDKIITSWQEGHMMEGLKELFSCMKTTRENIEWHFKENTPKPELIDSTLYDYEDDRILLSYLFEDNGITKEQYDELKQVIKSAQKQQIAMILDVYANKTSEYNRLIVPEKIKKQIIENPISHLNCPSKIRIGTPKESNKILIKIKKTNQ